MVQIRFSTYLIETTPLNIIKKGNSCQLAAGRALQEDVALEERVMQDCEAGEEYNRDSSTYDNMFSKIKSEIPGVNTPSVSGFLRRQFYTLYEKYLEYKAKQEKIAEISTGGLEQAAQNSSSQSQHNQAAN